MKKTQLRYPTLSDAMAAVQKERADEVGGHTYMDLVDQYGLAILFAEIATIVSRLKRIMWDTSDYQLINWDRLYDLLIDLGNFTDFLYREAQKQDRLENPEANKQREKSKNPKANKQREKSTSVPPLAHEEG